MGKFLVGKIGVFQSYLAWHRWRRRAGFPEHLEAPLFFECLNIILNRGIGFDLGIAVSVSEVVETHDTLVLWYGAKSGPVGLIELRV